MIQLNTHTADKPGTRMKSPSKIRKAMGILVVFVLLGLLIGCGSQTLLVGQWEMTKVMLGDKEYPADSFLDPTAQHDGSFILRVYGDGTVLSTGRLGTEKGSSEGTWIQISDENYDIMIDGTHREVKLVGDMMFMEINTENISMTIVFEKLKD